MAQVPCTPFFVMKKVALFNLHSICLTLSFYQILTAVVVPQVQKLIYIHNQSRAYSVIISYVIAYSYMCNLSGSK